ncbi:hypothetical protein [Streptomyces sp. 6N223]|uniref:hypothetical protein n=1 Tax=Streptomyces sp. 6N223 TaxID=3457412 RepID=UPI003FD210A2
MGALILGVVALVNFLASGGDDGGGDRESTAADASPAASSACPDRIASLIDVGEGKALSLAETYRTAEMRITVCRPTASADDDSGSRSPTCVIEFDDGGEPVVTSAQWGIGAYDCGDSHFGLFAVTISNDLVTVYENGVKTDEQALLT